MTDTTTPTTTTPTTTTPTPDAPPTTDPTAGAPAGHGPAIVIAYCTQCHWLLRAAWMAQELLSTFGTDLGEVALRPATGGLFRITYDGEELWERKRDGGFPDVKTLKQRVRDRLDPTRDLGHTDRSAAAEATSPLPPP